MPASTRRKKPGRKAPPPARDLGIDTPALLIHLEDLEANIAAMAAFFRKVKADLRPHFKTHKSTQIAWRQLRAGAIGITCATVDEGEALAAAGVRSILIANQVVGAGKIRRLAGVAQDSDVIVAIDAMANARDIARAARRQGVTVRCLVEVDVGMGRCGVSPKRAPGLARSVSRLDGLRLEGVMGYEGHCVFIEDVEERRMKTHEAMAKLTSAAKEARSLGLRAPIVSGGGTGTHDVTARYPGVTEVQAGSYATMDARYARLMPRFRNALTVLATVVARPSPRMAVLDAGLKAVTPEFGVPVVKDLPGVEVAKLAEEHAIARLDPGAPDLRVGDTLEIIPCHGCTTANLHGRYHCVRDGEVAAVWPIAASAFTR